MKKHIIKILFTSAAAFLAGVGAQAAPITWGANTTISGESDVLTAGVLTYGYTESGQAPTVNGVPFAAGFSYTSLGSGNVTLSGTGAFTRVDAVFSAPTGSTTAYTNLLKGGASGTSGVAGTVTLNNLTSGHVYAPQVWVNDSRAGVLSRSETITSAGGNTVTLKYSNSNSAGGAGQFTVGRFLAGGTTQAFTLQGNASSPTQLNAIQVRDITNIGNWVGTGGETWDAATTSNFSSNAFNAALSVTDFATAKAALNSVTFADSYWDGGNATTVTQTSVTVAAGGVSTGVVYFDNSAVSYTIGSADANGISGATALTKNGNGTVTLSGGNAYSGATTVNAGTLIVAGGGSINSSSRVSVGAGAVLTNDGVAITPAFVLNEGATLSGTGSFTPSALTITGDLSGGTFTTITLDSALTKAGTLAFTLTNVVGGSYSLFGGTTTPGGSFASVSVGGTSLVNQSGGIFSAAIGGFNYTYDDNLNSLGISAVPEPAAWALAGIGLAFMLYRKRFARALGRRNGERCP